MNDNLTELIRLAQKGNQECLLLIIEKLKPAILNHAKNLFHENFEDCVAELELAVLESVNKISVSELPFEEQSHICPYWEYEYGNCELKLDLENLLSACSAQQREILLTIIFDGKSSSQIAAELNTTRQYVNRIKNKWLKEIEKEIFTKETI